MSLPFDAALKKLAGTHARDFLTTFDQPPTEAVSILNVDLSTVTTAGDLILGLGDPLREIVHIDFQSSASSSKHADVLVYNALLHRHYLVAVHSILVLLRPVAAHRNTNGQVHYAPRSRRGKMEFQYEPVRLWERPVEQLLNAGPGILPLAMLGRLPEGVEIQQGLTSVAQRIIQRLEQMPTEQVRQLLTAAFVLTGLRLNRQQALQVFAGVKTMRDSDTYLAILDEGQELARKDDILRLGTKKFGPPETAITTRLQGITDLQHLTRIHDRLFEATTWQDLLSTP